MKVFVDYCGCGVYQDTFIIKEGHTERRGGDVSWCAASTARSFLEELFVAVYTKHATRYRRRNRRLHSVRVVYK